MIFPFLQIQIPVLKNECIFFENPSHLIDNTLLLFLKLQKLKATLRNLSVLKLTPVTLIALSKFFLDRTRSHSLFSLARQLSFFRIRRMTFLTISYCSVFGIKDRRLPYGVPSDWKALWYSNLDELQRVNEANDNNTISNVTVQLGGTAFLHCKARHMADRTISDAEVRVFFSPELKMATDFHLFTNSDIVDSSTWLARVDEFNIHVHKWRAVPGTSSRRLRWLDAANQVRPRTGQRDVRVSGK